MVQRKLETITGIRIGETIYVPLYDRPTKHYTIVAGKVFMESLEESAEMGENCIICVILADNRRMGFAIGDVSKDYYDEAKKCAKKNIFMARKNWDTYTYKTYRQRGHIIKKANLLFGCIHRKLKKKKT